MFGHKKRVQTLQVEIPVSKSHVKLVNFYSVIYDQREENRPLSGTLLDFSGKEFEFEWDDIHEQLASLVCPDDDIKVLRWELAERFLSEDLIEDDDWDDRPKDLAQQQVEEIYQAPSTPPVQQTQATPLKDLPKTVQRSQPTLKDLVHQEELSPNPKVQVQGSEEEEDISDDVLSRAFQNLDTVDDVLEMENEGESFQTGSRVFVIEDPSLRGLIRLIKDGRAQVFVEGKGDLSIPLSELQHDD